MVNAIKEGHQVLCVVSDHIHDAPLTVLALNEIGVPHVRGTQQYIMEELDRFNADAVFGEYRLGVAEEDIARDWAARKAKPHFLLEHAQFHAESIRPSVAKWATSTLLLVNDMVADAARAKGWPKMAVVGQPDLDNIESYNTLSFRERFHLPAKQVVIGLFLEHISGSGSPPGRSLEHERTNVNKLMDLANQRGWRVFVHCHAQERQGQGRLYHPQREAFLQEIQRRGGIFVAGFVPGTSGGVMFHDCSPFELIYCADAVTGSHLDTVLTTYAMRRKYFVFYGPNVYGSHPKSRTRIHYDQFRSEFPNFSTVGQGFSALIEAAELGKGTCRRDAALTQKWYHKLDGQAWRRIMDLLEKGE